MNDVVVAYPYDRHGRELYRVDHCFKDADGNSRRLKKRGFESRGAAISWAEKEITLIRTGVKKVVSGHKRGPRVNHTVESGLRKILQWMEDTSRLKPSTRFIHECALRKYVYPVVGSLRWEDLTQRHCDNLTEAARGMPTPRHLIALKVCLEAADKAGLPRLPVTVEVLKIRTNLRTDYLTREELDAICQQAPALWSAVFRFMFHTGLRVGELCALQWSDVDFRPRAETVRIERTVYFTNHGPQVQTTKSGRIRVLPLNAEAVKALRDIADERFPGEAPLPVPHDAPLARRLVLASSEKKEYLRPQTVRMFLRGACQRAHRKPISPHQLRHSHASAMVQAGIPLPVVSALLGHSSLQITGRYAHLAPDNLRAGVNALQYQTVTNKSE